MLCQFHRRGNWAQGRIRDFYPRSQSWVRGMDQLHLIPKLHSFPATLPLLDPAVGDLPHPHSTPQSEALNISCQGSSSDSHPGPFLGCEADNLFTGHRSGMAQGSVPVCLPLPSPLTQTLGESGTVISTDGLCWAHSSLGKVSEALKVTGWKCQSRQTDDLLPPCRRELFVE